MLSWLLLALCLSLTVFCDNIVITDVHTWIQNDRAWCNITCSDGITGFGQMGRYYKYKDDVKAIHQIFVDEVIPNILNYSCTTDLKNIMNEVIIKSYKNTGQMQSRALAGLSYAMYEIYAKRVNKSVGDYLGGDITKSIPIYGSSVTRSKSAQEIGENFVSIINDWGIKQFKFKIAQRMGNNTDVWVNRTEEVITTIREMVGDDITLMVDANGGYTEWKYVSSAVKLLEKYNYLWLEEPIPWWLYDEVKNIKNNITNLNYKLKIALGEQEYRMIDGWKSMINGKYVDIIQPDTCYGGGMANLLQVAQWSLDQKNEYKSVVIPHSPNTEDMTIVYTMHFFSLKNGNSPYPNIGDWMEFGCDNGIPTKDSDFLFQPKLQINKDGTVNINNGVGWGYTLKPSNDIKNSFHASI